jgi:hypothetical protein
LAGIIRAATSFTTLCRRLVHPLPYRRIRDPVIGANELQRLAYSEVIFFKDKASLDNFKQGDYEVAAGASAIALKDGVSKTADYEKGAATFTMGTGGLMFEASIGGQKFSFEPK